MILFIISPYILISFIVSILGALASYLLLPVMIDAFAAQTGFLWSQGFDVPVLLITVAILTIIISMACYLCASKIKRLHPIVALRGGLTTHNFKKNYFAFEKGKGQANMTLSLKNLMSNGKQNILLVCVTMIVTIATIFAGVIYYNMAVDSKTFIYAIVETNPDILFTINKDSDHTKVLEEIRENDQVWKAYYFDTESVMVENQDVKAFITEDFAELDNDFCFQGRNPLHRNEITIGYVTADILGVTIGDYVTVKNGSNQAKFLITGLIQSVNEAGSCVGITKDGFLNIAPDYCETTLDVCLNNQSSAGTQEFIEQMEQTYGNTITNSVNAYDIVNDAMFMFTNIAGIFSILILVVTIIIVAIVLYMIIKTAITRKRVDFGILKAVGYTTKQLKYQMALSLAPVVLIGAILGGVFSFIFMNQLIGVLFQVIGIMKLAFAVPLILVLGVVTVIFVIAFFLALALSGRIRKISAYSLMKD